MFLSLSQIKNWLLVIEILIRSGINQQPILHFDLNVMPKIPILKDSTTAVALCWALKQHFCVRSSITTPTLFMPSNKGGAKLWFTKYVLLPINTYNMHCWLCLLLLLVAKWIELGFVLYLRNKILPWLTFPLVEIVKGIPLLLYEKICILLIFREPPTHPLGLVNIVKERPPNLNRPLNVMKA